MTIKIATLEDLENVAKTILSKYSEDRVFLFYGAMGAGKTTLINAFCKQLEVLDYTSSPTFSIVNEYDSNKGTLYHFDFYRLKDETEALDMGYEEYLYSGNYCFVEWPNKINNLLPSEFIEVTIQVSEDLKRIITVKRN